MRKVPGCWPWEAEVNDRLGLDPTVASGNQFYDKGDGVDRGQGDWAFQVDAKFTQKASFSVKSKELGQWVERARMGGKRFVLAVRIWVRGQYQPTDYAVILFEDFEAMLARIKELEK